MALPSLQTWKNGKHGGQNEKGWWGIHNFRKADKKFTEGISIGP